MSVCDRALFACGRGLLGVIQASTIYHARLDVLALRRKISLHDLFGKECKDVGQSHSRMARMMRCSQLGAS